MLPHCKHALRKSIDEKCKTHLLNLIISVSSRSTATLRSYGCVSFFAAPCRTEVRAICPTSFCLCDSFRGLLLQNFHLIMKLRSKFLILLRELSDSVLRNPIIPLSHHVVRTISLMYREAVVSCYDNRTCWITYICPTNTTELLREGNKSPCVMEWK
jgi:hypothetical protein